MYKVIHNTSEGFPYAGAIEIPAGHIAKLIEKEADHILNRYEFFKELTPVEDYAKLSPNTSVAFVNFFLEPTVVETVVAQVVDAPVEAVVDAPAFVDPDAVEESDPATEEKDAPVEAKAEETKLATEEKVAPVEPTTPTEGVDNKPRNRGK